MVLSYVKLSTKHRAQLPRTLDETEKDNHGRKRSRATATSGNSSRPRLSTSPTSPTLNNPDALGAYYHQPRDNRKDDDHAARDIAAASSPGGSTTGNAPDPGLRDPTETLPPDVLPCTAGHGLSPVSQASGTP